MSKAEFVFGDLMVKEHLFYAYANLAMAHSAVDKNQTKYDRFNYMIRSKLYKGLLTGEMNIRTLFDDEKIKLSVGDLEIALPENLYFIGTMNEIDFSLERVDFALRRRFLWQFKGFDGVKSEYVDPRVFQSELPADCNRYLNEWEMTKNAKKICKNSQLPKDGSSLQV